MSLRPTSKRLQSLVAYITSMLCPACKGENHKRRKCKKCAGRGTSDRYELLKKKAVEGIHK